MMKIWIVALLACLLSTAAVAQTGSAKTATALNTEINNTLATGLSPPISASALRQVVLDMVSTAYSLVDVADPAAPTLTITGATALTTSQPVLSMTQTWVTAGTTYTGIKLNVTNTASAAASILMDLQVGSSSVFQVTEAGTVIAPSNLILQSGGTVTFNVAGANLVWQIETTGHIFAGADNTYDLGASGSNRSRDVNVGRHLQVGNGQTVPALSTCGAATAAGTGSTDTGGNFTTGTASTACTLTFNVAYTTNAWCTITPANAAAATNITGTFIATSTRTAFTITTPSVATLKYNYTCSGS